MQIKPVSWKKFEKVVLLVGCTFVRQKGDHRVYWRSDFSRPVVIPQYNQLPVFIIQNNLRLLGLSRSEYLKILTEV